MPPPALTTKSKISSKKEAGISPASAVGGLLSERAGLLPDPAFSKRMDIIYSGIFLNNVEYALGAAHYSYSFASNKFTKTLSKMGLELKMIERPESIPLIDTIKQEKQVIHLIWRSTEEIRILKGAYNIVCFAWEFEVLRDFDLPRTHPFINQRRMLALVDEIWVPSSYAADILKKYGLENVHFIPAPIEEVVNKSQKTEPLLSLGQLGVVPLYINSLQSAEANREVLYKKKKSLINVIMENNKKGSHRTIFLAILNPEDERKNLDLLLRSFDYFSRVNQGCFLVVKLLTSQKRHTIEDVVSRFVGEKLEGITTFNNNNILFLNDFLSDEDMASLYALADFYISLSIAEGQNLPLIEAMAAGCISISPSVTAMRDYITLENSVVVKTEEMPEHKGSLAGNIALRPFSYNGIRFRSAVEALQAALSLTPTEREIKKLAAAKTTSDLFGFNRVARKIHERFSAIVGVTQQYG